jgi:hypothetical protein
MSGPESDWCSWITDNRNLNLTVDVRVLFFESINLNLITYRTVRNSSMQVHVIHSLARTSRYISCGFSIVATGGRSCK